jgi:hypothetical protein
MDSEFLLYDPELFEERLESAREHIIGLDNRPEADRRAFDAYVKAHRKEMTGYTPHGYIQWQGSDAQELLWQDVNDGKLATMKMEALWQSREEYRNEFPLSVFRKKVEQEQRTKTYLHTVKTHGIDKKAS